MTLKRRSFNISGTTHKAGNSVMDIPHLGILRYLKPKDLMARHKEKWGKDPDGVALPVTYSDGLLFDVEGLNDLRSPNAKVSDELKGFEDVVTAFAKLGLDIYLVIDPTLQFVRTDALHIVDIVKDSSSSVCIGNPRSRDVIAAILGTAIDITLVMTEELKGKLKGVVLDAVNIWPMGAVNNRLELTCFCPSCEKHFTAENKALLSEFRTFPSPWNLVLKDTGTGISYIDDIRPGITAREIVGLSRQKGFHEVFGSTEQAFLERQAELLLEYIRIRHEQTMFAINDIFRQSLQDIPLPKELFPKRIVLIEGVNYGWTSGIQLKRLDRIPDESAINPYDEVWFDPSSTELVMEHVPFRSFMWKRSRYYIDAFLHFAATVSSPVLRAITGASRLSKAQAKDVLVIRLGQALGTAMTGQTSLISLPQLCSENEKSQRTGFVGVALDKELGDKLIDSIEIEPGSREQKFTE